MRTSSKNNPQTQNSQSKYLSKVLDMVEKSICRHAEVANGICEKCDEIIVDDSTAFPELPQNPRNYWNP